jgi:putative addiction module CopG family antidote
MAKRSPPQLTLTPKWQSFVQRSVTSGRYKSPSDVVREALRLLQLRDHQSRPIRTVADLKREVMVGVRQAEAGMLIDGPTAMREIRQRLQRTAKARRKRSRSSLRSIKR